MTRAEFEAWKKRHPDLVEEDESVKRGNPRLYGTAKQSKIGAEVSKSADVFHHQLTSNLCVIIHGQIKGGKNNMVVTRNGRHFPRKEWAAWRDAAVREVKTQLPKGFVPFSTETLVTMGYYAGDKRRRDEPAIKDAIWHVLEKAGVVTDDTLLWTTHSWRHYDKQNPRVELWLKGVAE